ncbi:SgcJ/EcaC family oxidoreductase [Microbacterium protaetiae]|uniref:SgcJ/EcaC family oxidoreductase n=1 Tax=Microbacterium protaetiae TaxID=2509458 RepID=UPI0013EA9CFC|nr:SgcJ/EcaC family oxidoreductase [Microbacterium protaetiae]
MTERDTRTGTVEALIEKLRDAWAAGDAAAYAALHEDDARYVAFDGTVMRGRAEIAAGHAPLFAGIMRGSRLAAVEQDVHAIDDDTVLVVQRAGIIMRWQSGRSTPSRKRLSTNTTLAHRRDGEWRVSAFQNTRYRPFNRTLMGRLMTRRARG